MKTFRRSASALLVLLPLLFATGCSQAAAPSPSPPGPPAKDYKGLFELKLYTDKLAYRTTEKIAIWATLEYVGENSGITIWHGDPPITFRISDGKKFDSGGIVYDILTSTSLDKGKPYRFEYQKSGGYDANQSDAAFWKKFYSEKDLYLPAGKYTVTVRGDFSVNENDPGEKNNLDQSVEITVTR